MVNLSSSFSKRLPGRVNPMNPPSGSVRGEPNLASLSGGRRFWHSCSHNFYAYVFYITVRINIYIHRYSYSYIYKYYMHNFNLLLRVHLDTIYTSYFLQQPRTRGPSWNQLALKSSSNMLWPKNTVGKLPSCYLTCSELENHHF